MDDVRLREEEVCFLGGSTPVGSPCDTLFECTVGSICVVVGTDQSLLMQSVRAVLGTVEEA